MPILRQRKDGSGYYVRAWVPGTIAIGTWQLTAAGVSIIRSRGYQGEEVEFPQALLRQLIDRGEAYTGRSGLTLSPPLLKIAHERAPLIRSRAVSLLFAERDVGWEFVLQISEIPTAWVEGVADIVSALSGWQIVVSGAPPIPAMRLYPGRGGARISVAPQREPYAISAEGALPKEWSVTSWLIPPAGLGGGIALFRGDTGERLWTDTPLEPGESYTLVVPEHLTAGPKRLLPPPQLSPEHLGRVSQWHAWSIEVPKQLDEQVRSWCVRAGLQLAEPRFRLSLVTPPRGYSEVGQAIITAGEEVVLALAPLQPQEGLKTSFYTARVEQIGALTLSIEDIAVTPLRLLVVPGADSIQQVTPAALTLDVAWGGNIVSFKGLGGAQHTLQRPTNASAEAPYAEVRCPAPVALMLRLGERSVRQQELSADDAGPQIAKALHEAGRCGLALTIEIDAGSFGRLSLIAPARTEALTTTTLSPTTLRRARWLAAALPAISRSENSIPVPASLQQALNRIARQAGCESLREVRAIPASLLPALRAVARDILKLNGTSHG